MGHPSKIKPDVGTIKPYGRTQAELGHLLKFLIVFELGDMGSDPKAALSADVLQYKDPEQYYPL